MLFFMFLFFIEPTLNECYDFDNEICYECDYKFNLG